MATGMPKKGYTNLTVPVELYELLKKNAESRNLSIPEYIASELITLNNIKSLLSTTNGEGSDLTKKPWTGFEPVVSTLPRWRIANYATKASY